MPEGQSDSAAGEEPARGRWGSEVTRGPRPGTPSVPSPGQPCPTQSSGVGRGAAGGGVAHEDSGRACMCCFGLFSLEGSAPMRSTSVPADSVPLGRMAIEPFRAADNVPMSEFSRSRNAATRGSNTPNRTPAGARAYWCGFSSNGRRMPWAGGETRWARSGCVSGWPDGPDAGVQRRGRQRGNGLSGWSGVCIQSATIAQKPLLGPARGAVVLEEEGHLRPNSAAPSSPGSRVREQPLSFQTQPEQRRPVGVGHSAPSRGRGPRMEDGSSDRGRGFRLRGKASCRSPLKGPSPCGDGPGVLMSVYRAGGLRLVTRSCRPGQR